jgi:hypothetical protein
LDDATARWTRIEAAKREMSVSSFLREILNERMLEDASSERAMARYLSRPSKRLGGPRPHRDEVHDRAGLR